MSVRVSPFLFRRRLRDQFVAITGEEPPLDLAERLTMVAARSEGEEERGALRLLLRALYPKRR